MQMYDVRRQDLFEIKSTYTYHVALNAGESLAGFGGVEVYHTGYRLIITADEGVVWGYRIDYDTDGDVMYPITPADLRDLIEDLTAIGCYEYTPDLLRAIQQRKTDLKPWEVDHRLRL